MAECDAIIDGLFALLRRHGNRAYSEASVSQTEHMLQTAMAAERAGAPDALVVASLLHDIGHLLETHGPEPAARGVDARHEDSGAAHLARFFGPDVVEPVRLHVPAKRYLCAASPGYCERLSPGSVRSLKLQGGPMSAAECAAFRAGPFFRDAVRLRSWDEAGKVGGLLTPGLEHYRPRLRAALAAG
jgi:phosphonate degradation associated HDIG domain protein